jgi:hypothetical protein
MVLKDRDRIRKRHSDDGCDKETSCGNYVHYRGTCLFMDKKNRRCKIDGKDQKRVGLSPAGGIL